MRNAVLNVTVRFAAVVLIASAALAASAAGADLILHSGKVATVDEQFSIHEAIAVRDGKVLRAGSNDEIRKLKEAQTIEVDLGGKLVIPGLMDSHAHSARACLNEFDHVIPSMETIDDVLKYVGSRAETLPEGNWIEVRQVFITRLKEQRYPTRAELDRAAPRHPVIFQTGPDASLNSLALRLSGIDRNFKVSDGGSGFAEMDPKSGEPTGILRNCTRYVKVVSPLRKPSFDERRQKLAELFRDYTAWGITAICDRDASPADIDVYHAVSTNAGAAVRVAISHHVDSIGELPEVEAGIERVARHPLFQNPHEMVRVIGVKTYLDGGMLTGSAYMRQPWGVSKIYNITDPGYRGVLFIEADRLRAMVKAATEAGLQFTAHSVGDGAVHALLDAYEEVNREGALRKTRPCVSHSNFMSKEAVEKAARLGVFLDIQPVWLYLDTRTLSKQFSYERLRYFQPLASIFAAGGIAGGGSDHMQKIGADRAVNRYNPFLGMATAVTRTARDYEGRLHPEEALSREQAIRFYTINNARMLFLDDRAGSLEPGKSADLIVLDSDLLTCPSEAIARTRVLRTYFAGKLVHSSEKN